MKIGNVKLENIYQRKETGIYYFKKQFNGILHRISLHTKDPFEAHQIVKKWNEEYLYSKIRGTQSVPLLNIQKEKQIKDIKIEGNRLSLLQTYNNYLRTCKNDHNSTERIQGKERFKNVLVSNKWIWDDLTHENVLDLQDNIQKDHKPHTAYKVISYLKGFLNYCIEQGYFDYNEYKRIKFMKRPPRTNVRTKISDKDLEKIKYHLYSKHDIDFAYLIETLSITASRPAEIINLTRKSIDYDNCQLNIFQNKVKETKPISVPKGLLDKLMDLMRLNESKDGYIFHGAMRNRSFYIRKFKELKDELNLNPLYELRMIRHTSISFVAKNFGVAIAQQIAGHSNIKTTLDHYYIPDADNVKQATDELAKKWSS